MGNSLWKQQQRQKQQVFCHAWCYLVMAPEKRLPAWSSKSLCVVND
jgi:hypothetical protein